MSALTEQQKEGLREQIRLDREQIRRTVSDAHAIKRLREHIDYCEQQLQE